jgi:two-component system OmpR family response regulator
LVGRWLCERTISRGAGARGSFGRVSRGRVLIIEADEWLTTLVSKFLIDAGYTTQVATTARRGYDEALASQPACVLCDVVLPDIDGYWVTRRIRAEKNKLGGTPILLLSQKEDHAARVEGLALGADVFLTPPFRYDEVIAQVDALIGMATRLRSRLDSFQSDMPISGGPAALHGDISQISVPTFLTMLEMERRTGRVRMQTRGKPAITMELVEGTIVHSQAGGHEIEPLETMRDVVAWKKGKYSFESKPIELAGRTQCRISMLLLDAIRLNDEQSQS